MRTVPIRVSKKILADVSSGIYRTPANALKEIVSNAFDAVRRPLAYRLLNR